MYTEIVARQEVLDRYLSNADWLDQSEGSESEIASGYRSFLCMRVYAYVEFSVLLILRRYVASAIEDKPIIEFVTRDLKRRRRNLDAEQLLHLIGMFGADWRREIVKGLQYRAGDSLDSIVNFRNKIAHGDDVQIHPRDMKNFIDDAKEIVNLVFVICRHNSSIEAKRS